MPVSIARSFWSASVLITLEIASLFLAAQAQQAQYRPRARDGGTREILERIVIPPIPHTANPVPLLNEPVVEFDRKHNPLRDELLEHNPRFQEYLESCLRSRSLSKSIVANFNLTTSSERLSAMIGGILRARELTHEANRAANTPSISAKKLIVAPAYPFSSTATWSDFL